MLISDSILRVHPKTLAPGLLSGVRDLKLAVLRYILTYQVCPAIHWNPAAEYVVVNRKAMVVSKQGEPIMSGTPPCKRPYQDLYSSCQVHHNVF